MMTRLHPFIGALLVIVGLSGSTTTLRAQAAPESQTGLKLGSKAPDFTLKSQDGTEHSLSEYLKKGKVALVFYRSADW